MRLYSAADVKAAALAKHGSKQGLAEKLEKNARAAAKRAATIAAKGGGGGGGGRRRRREEDSDGYESNDLQCPGCGATAAVDCAYGRCCHCCRDIGGGCSRHDRGDRY